MRTGPCLAGRSRLNKRPGSTGRWSRRSGPRRRRAGGLAGGRLVGAGRALGLVGLAGGADVVARVGVEAARLAGGRLVGAGLAGDLGRLAGGADVVSRGRVGAARLAGGRLVGAGRALGLGGLACGADVVARVGVGAGVDWPADGW